MIDIDIFSAVLGFSWVVYFWESYLGSRQRKIYNTVNEPPPELKSLFDRETFEKSRCYALDKSLFGFWKGLYSQLESTLILWYGGLPFLWMLSGRVLNWFNYGCEYEILQSLVFVLLGNVYGLVTGLPWSLYSTFVVEERHGFNKMTLGFFLKDLAKQTLVSQLITLPLMAIVIYVVQAGGEYFFVYAWLVVFIISMVLMHVYPEYIAPLFDKYSPLPDGELKTEIEGLAKSLNFPLTKLYVVEGSKRSAHSNAYMYGFNKNKRIVLFDTLLEDYTPVGRTDEKDCKVEDEKAGDVQENSEKEDVKEEKKDKKIGCNTEEVVAVLGHELGHWQFSHMVKNLAVMQVSIFFSFFIFGKLMYNREIFSAFGFVVEQPILIRLFIVFSFIFSPINEVEAFLMKICSRRFEFQADEFAINLGKKEKLKSALLKLFKDNLSFPVADWLFSTCNFSHPPLLERLRAMEKYKQKKE